MRGPEGVIQNPQSHRRVEDRTMRVPRVRFTVRQIMVAVAVVSLALCGENYRRKRATEKRRESYETRARIYRSYASQFRDSYRETDIGRLLALLWSGVCCYPGGCD